MQWLAYYSDAPQTGLYVATHDPFGADKSLATNVASNGATTTFVFGAQVR